MLIFGDWRRDSSIGALTAYIVDGYLIEMSFEYLLWG